MLLAYDDDGPGPVVVLLHGFPLNRRMWSAQETSVGSIYRVIAPDLRGHGKSQAPEGIYTIDEMADDVIQLLNALQIREPVVLGGLSMGGYVALSLILRYPGRFRALMLMDTRASADTPDAARLREELALKVEASGKAGHVVEAMFPKLVSESTRKHRPELLEPIRTAMEKTPARTLVGTLRGLATRPDRTADLPKIQVPTLVMVGAHDVITPPDEVRAMAEKIPGAKFLVIPDAGHLAPLENPNVADKAILDFLAGLP
jgi:pimeloyl-ACP methyl ester carboxylesterase